jgi:sulfite exporter TauE/SafE
MGSFSPGKCLSVIRPESRLPGRLIRKRQRGLDQRCKQRRLSAMLLRLVAYWALGISAAIRHQFVIAGICLVIPFMGAMRMWLAAFAGILFLVVGLYVHAIMAFGALIFNLEGNRRLQERTPKIAKTDP